MKVLEIQNLVKTYENGFEAVKNITLSAEKNEFLVLVGPSGCGKTTILRTIAGLEELTSGDILLNGKNITNLEPKKRNVGMVFQNYALYPHLTVYDNIAFPLKIAKIKKDKIDILVKEVAEIVGLSEYINSKPKELSGGQRQRTALARAIVRKPDIFLFDEPLSNLDANLRVQMRSEIIRLHKKVGIVSVYVTHDQVEAMTMATKIAVMSKGNIHQIASPHDIYNKPIDLFTAEFIGNPKINIIKGLLSQKNLSTNKDIIFNNLDRSINIVILENNNNVKYINKNIYLCIRPEKLSIEKQNYKHSFKVNINYIENLGYERIIYCKVGNENIQIKTASNIDIQIAQEIDVYYNPNDFLIFDEEKKNINYKIEV